VFALKRHMSISDKSCLETTRVAAALVAINVLRTAPTAQRASSDGSRQATYVHKGRWQQVLRTGTLLAVRGTEHSEKISPKATLNGGCSRGAVGTRCRSGSKRDCAVAINYPHKLAQQECEMTTCCSSATE
jgi:hypothetical protein